MDIILAKLKLTWDPSTNKHKRNRLTVKFVIKFAQIFWHTTSDVMVGSF